MPPDDIHDIAARRLSGSHLRYTASRRALVEVLSRSPHPLTLPQILGSDTSLAQSSAYRNLGELIGAGVVHRIVTSDEHAHFELAEDLTEHHHHLICSSCGAVADFTIGPKLEDSMAEAFARVGQETGFQTDHHRLDLVGRCTDCR